METLAYYKVVFACVYGLLLLFSHQLLLYVPEWYLQVGRRWVGRRWGEETLLFLESRYGDMDFGQ